MDLETFYDYCLSKKGVTEHFPFDDNTLVFKVGGKMFALSSLKQWELRTPSINLKCDPDYALELRSEYDAIQPGYHSNKKHWNTIKIDESISDVFVKELIDHSYNLVFAGLSKKCQTEILN